MFEYHPVLDFLSYPLTHLGKKECEVFERKDFETKSGFR